MIWCDDQQLRKLGLFFAPTAISDEITRESPLLAPILIIAVLQGICYMLPATPGVEGLRQSPYDVIVSLLLPFMLGLLYHWAARIIGGVGAARRMIGLLYYAWVGGSLCALALTVLFVVVPDASTKPLAIGAGSLLPIYWLGVATYCAQENYSLTFTRAVGVTALVVMIPLGAFVTLRLFG
jgi:hypothetical protein